MCTTHYVYMIERCSSLIVCCTDFDACHPLVTALRVKLCDTWQCWAAAVRRGAAQEENLNAALQSRRDVNKKIDKLLRQNESLHWTYTASLIDSPSIKHPLQPSADCQLCVAADRPVTELYNYYALWPLGEGDFPFGRMVNTCNMGVWGSKSARALGASLLMQIRR